MTLQAWSLKGGSWTTASYYLAIRLAGITGQSITIGQQWWAGSPLAADANRWVQEIDSLGSRVYRLAMSDGLAVELEAESAVLVPGMPELIHDAQGKPTGVKWPGAGPYSFEALDALCGLSVSSSPPAAGGPRLEEGDRVEFEGVSLHRSATEWFIETAATAESSPRRVYLTDSQAAFLATYLTPLTPRKL